MTASDTWTPPGEFEFVDADDPRLEFITPEPANDEVPDFTPGVDENFVEEKKQTPRAKTYSKKAKSAINFLVRTFAGHPVTVADSAALIHHGPGISQAFGDLCDKDARVRKAVDLITDDGIENPYLLTALTVLPFFFQVMRNHEPKNDKVAGFNIRIPFSKRRIRVPISIRIRFRMVQNTTYPPAVLTESVFGNPAIMAAMEKQGIKVAWRH